MHTTALVVAAVALIAIPPLPAPDHPVMAAVASELKGRSPLIVGARYDAANHFMLVDVHGLASEGVVWEIACGTVRPALDAVDPTVRFGVFKGPDRLLVHGDECDAASDPGLEGSL
jgi:hypothetical protein